MVVGKLLHPSHTTEFTFPTITVKKLLIQIYLWLLVSTVSIPGQILYYLSPSVLDLPPKMVVSIGRKKFGGSDMCIFFNQILSLEI